MFNGIEFSSVFKIEEKSILRPCLSESKREEMKRFKARALDIEKRLADKKINNYNIESTTETYTQEDRSDFQENIHKFAEDIESCSGQSEKSENHTDLDADNENFVTSISEWDISSIPGLDHDNGRVSLCSAATEPIDYPSEILNDTAGQSIDNTFVPAPNVTLIRSDSFIVDQPSECFLKQLEYNGVVVPSTSNSLTDISTKTELNETKIFVKSVEKRKPEAKKNSNPKVKKYPPKPFPFKKNRIPSDNISNLPDKLIRKCQNNAVSVVDLRKERQQKVVPKQLPMVSDPTRRPTSSMESSFTQTDTIHNCCDDTSAMDERISAIVATIEEKFHNEIALFLDKQKREQEAFMRKLMSQVKVKQDAFQCNLVMQIKTLIGDGVSTLLKNQDNLPVLHNTPNLMNDVNGNFSSSLEMQSDDCRQEEKIRAAIKINAFVRGYLTRRLFKTEHVQEVIKTIRDTLYLVIDLHFENNDVESLADIQMKHNLLQQLESNRYTLSQIFVTKTPAEQMAMIAFDRQVMMHRLVQSNSKNKTKGPSSVNRQRSMGVEDKLKKLKIIEL